MIWRRRSGRKKTINMAPHTLLGFQHKLQHIPTERPRDCPSEPPTLLVSAGWTPGGLRIRIKSKAALFVPRGRGIRVAARPKGRYIISVVCWHNPDYI